MRHRTTATIHDLRVAIDCLPRDTRSAMLKGIQSGPIIVGAYTDGEGICPMLAAHRNGGRTSFIAFARAWDRFAFRGAKGRCSRRATPRELLVLRTHLEASLLSDEHPTQDLSAAITEHRAAVEAHRPPVEAHTSPVEAGGTPVASDRAARVRPGDPDRSRELRHRHGWRWMGLVRTIDDYERVLAALEAQQDAAPPVPTSV